MVITGKAIAFFEYRFSCMNLFRISRMTIMPPMSGREEHRKRENEQIRNPTQLHSIKVGIKKAPTEVNALKYLEERELHSAHHFFEHFFQFRI